MTDQKKTISRKVKIVSALFMTAVFLLLGIIVAELVCRQMPEYARPGYEFDPTLLFRLKRDRTIEKPYAMGKVEGKGSFEMKINDYGFRNDAFNPRAEKKGKRILFVGDSYTAGLDYPKEEIFSNQVHQKLTIAGIEMEVLNASCPAWAYDQYYLYWTTEGYALNPDYLILMSAPNDIREAYNKHIMHLDEQGDLHHYPISYPREKLLGWKVANRSSFYQFLQKNVFKTDYGNFFQVFHTYPVHFGKEDADNWDLPLFMKAPFKEVTESYQLAEVLLKKLHQSCKEKGTQLILSTIPTTTDFDGKLDTARYQPGLPAAFMKAFAEKENIPYIDLYTALADSGDPLRIFMSWEFHFNKTGHEFVSHVVGEWLEKELSSREH